MTDFAIRPSVSSSFAECVRQLRNYIRRHSIGSLLLGVSGGADSVLALHMLAEAARGIPGFRLGVAHANFHLRDEESLRDERFVRRLAGYYCRDAIFFFRDFNTSDFAKENHLSIEMAARILRHDWWDEICEINNFGLIATGHNADDNEETLFLNMLRGSSPRGLRGMSPLGHRIFRPLLGLHRKDILRLLSDFEASMRENQEFPAGYVTDSSNLTSDYRRNFIRNVIIPRLEEKWDGLHAALQTTLRLQSQASVIIDYAISEFLSKHHISTRNEITWSDLKTFPAPESLIFHWLSPHGISSTTAMEIASHIPQNPSDSTFGSRWTLPDGAEILTTPLSLKLLPSAGLDPFKGFIPPDESLWDTLPAAKVDARQIRASGNNEIYVPYPPHHYEWRDPREGDRMKLFPDKNGHRGSKLVSDILREAGITVSQRNSVKMMVNRLSGDIIWIPFIRRAGEDLIDSNQETIYHLRICTNKN